jgi:hypothetical protein
VHNTDVIGGDLLLKRAHANSVYADTSVLGGDLQVAEDYERYLNNREAINAVMAANPDTAFTAGWIATFARVNDLGLNHYGASDFLGGLVGYLDSVDKAGLGAAAANATVKRGGDNSVIVEVKVAGSAEVPGSLSVFADRVNIAGDAGGQTVQLTVDGGLGASGFHFLGAGASSGDGGTNDFWIGGNGGVTFNGTGGHDILVGGAQGDIIHAGNGFDFVDGGAVAENAPNGRWVATVTGLDPDAGTVFNYSLTDNAARRSHRSPTRNRRTTTRRRIRGSGWRYVREATASMTCIQVIDGLFRKGHSENTHVIRA